MNGKKTNKHNSAVVYLLLKRRKIKYVEIEHKYDYIDIEKFHNSVIESLKNKGNRLNSIINDMKRKLN